MKKLGRILAIIFLAVPLIFGAMFLSPNLAHNATQTAQNGGGGANSLTSPETADNSDFDDLNSGKEAEEYVVQIKDNSSYFTDYILPTNINGNGTEMSPYQVNSLEDFLFLTKVSMRNKYVELNCDIILNEERFDTNGTPSGGDGVVYQWEPFVNFTETAYASLIGNGHSIKGMYISGETKENISLFGKTNITKVENLKFENVYLSGSKYIYSIAHSVNKILNVDILSGTLKGLPPNYYDCCGYCSDVYQIIDCDNFAKIEGCGGMANYALNNLLIDNCNFYGELSGFSWVGGIIVRVQNKGTIRNSNVYGKVNGDSIYVGGFVGIAYYGESHIIFENCNFYGEMNEGALYAGGFLGRNGGKCDIINCKSFGKITSPKNQAYMGFLIGSCYDGAKTKDKVTNIINCEIEKNDAVAIVGMVDGAIKVNLENIKINTKASGVSYGIFYGIYNNCEVNIKNITVQGVQFTNVLYTLNNSKLYIENLLYVISTEKDMPIWYRDFSNNAFVYVNGVVVIREASKKNEFYGSDFSGFYTDWKTGKIGLKALSGKGFYQGRLTEEILINKGFEKKVI